MLFGTKVTSKQEATVPQDDQILHISTATLLDCKSNDKTTVFVHFEGKKHAFCVLQNGKVESSSVDLFVRCNTDVKFTVTGPGSVDLVGYFEPSPAESDEDDDEDMANAEAFQNAVANVKKGLKAAAEGENATTESGDDNDSDDDDSDDDSDDADDEKPAASAAAAAEKSDENEEDADSDDEDDSDDSDDDDDDSDDDKKKPAPVPAKPSKNEKGKKAAAAAPAAKEGKKGKEGKENQAAASPNNKRPADKPLEKKDAKKGKPAAASDHSTFVKSLKDYLSANGKTELSSLGVKVKKPADVQKLGAFLRERPQEFKLENNMVSLAK
eukprot:GHVP01004419.1.p5 GENE.GHVP01004419.1~~GHVP01004419.1.p5  ORF type:complete len:326 (-),score=103.34 GHVP01004419.1:3346-4323(-)